MRQRSKPSDELRNPQAKLSPSGIGAISSPQWAGAGHFVVVTTALTGFVRQMFPRRLFEPPTAFKAVSPGGYAPGVMDEKLKKDWRRAPRPDRDFNHLRGAARRG